MLPFAILYVASILTPGKRRADWLKEWKAELPYIPPREAARFCMGAFEDALWLRRHASSTPLESPGNCLAWLAAAAIISLCLASLLLAQMRHIPAFTHMRPTELPRALVITLLYSAVLLPASLQSMVWPRNVRAWLFLATKILLIQPTLLCMMMVWILIAPIAPLAPYAIFGVCILCMRWVLADQRNRCPVCLRRLSNPVRIGTPSETFLEWYGAETICASGHGLLHTPEIASSYARKPLWLRLDPSWTSLFERNS